MKILLEGNSDDIRSEISSLFLSPLKGVLWRMRQNGMLASYEELALLVADIMVEIYAVESPTGPQKTWLLSEILEGLSSKEKTDLSDSKFGYLTLRRHMCEKYSNEGFYLCVYEVLVRLNDRSGQIEVIVPVKTKQSGAAR